MDFCFVGAKDVIKGKKTKSPKFGGYSYLQIWGKKKGYAISTSHLYVINYVLLKVEFVFYHVSDFLC